MSVRKVNISRSLGKSTTKNKLSGRNACLRNKCYCQKKYVAHSDGVTGKGAPNFLWSQAEVATDPEHRSRRRSRILSFFQESETKICEKRDPNPRSLSMFGNSGSQHGFHNCRCLITNIADLRLHRCFPEFEQESGSETWKFCECGFKNFGTAAGFKNVTPAAYDLRSRPDSRTGRP